ncbi:hypothetical protein LX36DRAFT_79260 [Colletotrichum falcatum]|nr:hypothetical protein LX36DRAFT_79260 [Colletotrichum falcatum]
MYLRLICLHQPGLWVTGWQVRISTACLSQPVAQLRYDQARRLAPPLISPVLAPTDPSPAPVGTCFLEPGEWGFLNGRKRPPGSLLAICLFVLLFPFRVPGTPLSFLAPTTIISQSPIHPSSIDLSWIGFDERHVDARAGHRFVKFGLFHLLCWFMYLHRHSAEPHHESVQLLRRTWVPPHCDAILVWPSADAVDELASFRSSMTNNHRHGHHDPNHLLATGDSRHVARHGKAPLSGLRRCANHAHPHSHRHRLVAWGSSDPIGSSRPSSWYHP